VQANGTISSLQEERDELKGALERSVCGQNELRQELLQLAADCAALRSALAAQEDLG
jgi:hypothetical protein